MHIDFFTEQLPDATTLLPFRHLIEDNKLGKMIFDVVKEKIDKAGLVMHGGTIVEATIISAPGSTKNKDGKHVPEMHQTNKGKQWCNSMKKHSGVDAGSGYVHSITGIASTFMIATKLHL